MVWLEVGFFESLWIETDFIMSFFFFFFFIFPLLSRSTVPASCRLLKAVCSVFVWYIIWVLGCHPLGGVANVSKKSLIRRFFTFFPITGLYITSATGDCKPCKKLFLSFPLLKMEYYFSILSLQASCNISASRLQNISSKGSFSFGSTLVRPVCEQCSILSLWLFHNKIFKYKISLGR